MIKEEIYSNSSLKFAFLLILFVFLPVLVDLVCDFCLHLFPLYKVQKWGEVIISLLVAVDTVVDGDKPDAHISEHDIMDTTRSDKIKAGLQRNFRSGKSAKASIVCYGYKVDSKGKLQIYSTEAAHVLYIFERFAAGDSLGKISDARFLMDIPSPTGKEIWSKETISKILSNEKYIGDVILGKIQIKSGVQVKTNDLSTRTTLTSHHSAIISKELFDSVQKEKSRRHRLRER